ncbi:FxsA family protein [Corynebacterium heidelbergense]|uniref:Membrane protein FxsA n=1 Tax=Corynebacterium heidelbergense TaxID=2055947 RepID=A0A364V4Y0_9CORY|nr:FxsA family protein [Corynebacterium heidelbergense]RAV31694.1 hypothetical protein DLJ54_07055 [Corynebacterium heidelbergense]
MTLFSAAYLLVEIIAFVLLGLLIGFGWALLVLFVLFVLGVALAAWQMRALARRAQNQTENPGKLTADMAFTAFGAFLVALPGLVATFLGILMLLPPTRALLRKVLKGAAERFIIKMGGSSFITASRYGAPGTRDVKGWGDVIDHRDLP